MTLRTLPAFAACVVLLAGIAGCDKSDPAAKGDKSATGPATAVAQVECVVCTVNGHPMKTALKDSTPRSTADGKTYYFCSKDCKEEFDKEPAKFAKK